MYGPYFCSGRNPVWEYKDGTVVTAVGGETRLLRHGGSWHLLESREMTDAQVHEMVDAGFGTVSTP